MASAPDPAQLLRQRGMRSTPQRRAILAAFDGSSTEHLSADEVFSRASQSLPDLSRATVYATLAEFSEVGLLAAFGTPEPVRYETNTTHHAHFHCRLCLRIFDLPTGQQDPAQIKVKGFRAERVDTRVEGVCADCGDYEGGLRAGARAISRTGPPVDNAGASGVTAIEVDTPLGSVVLAATGSGVIRLAFAEHADAPKLRSLAHSRRGGAAARRHLATAAQQLELYFAGAVAVADAEIDWTLIEPGDAVALQATLEIPYGARRSYVDLAPQLPARHLGLAMGANPIPIFAPCHRVSRGVEVPGIYVGGPERRRWLEAHERRYSALS